MADDTEFLFPVFERKSNAYTRKNKYPRTILNTDFIDWSSNPLQNGNNMYNNPLRSLWYPVRPLKEFRPLAPMDEEKEHRVRNNLSNPKGLKRPTESLHYGYRVFGLDPSTKQLRHFSDPIPHPLHTIARQSYVDPKSIANLFQPEDTSRFGLSPKLPALGIVPLVVSIPPEPVQDTSESKDYVYVPKYEKKRGDFRRKKIVFT